MALEEGLQNSKRNEVETKELPDQAEKTFGQGQRKQMENTDEGGAIEKRTKTRCA